MRELYILCLKGGLVSPKWAWKTACTALRRTFHQIKVRQQIGREDGIQAVCRRMRKLEGFYFLYEAAKNFNSFKKNQNQNLKM
jgi:hypothetical protein